MLSPSFWLIFVIVFWALKTAVAAGRVLDDLHVRHVGHGGHGGRSAPPNDATVPEAPASLERAA